MISMESAMSMLPQTADNSYKMTEEDVKRLIEFRASNEALFTGKRNSAKIAWNTILKGLGLQGKLTADQIAKKWDNLRTKYKDLKQPYHNHESGGSSDSWPWFSIMDEAMQGRLYNSSLVLNPDAVNSLSNALAAACHHGNGQSASSESAENADILEFLIKTEMEDTVAAEAAGDSRRAPGSAPGQGVPMGWRRISECTYKSMLTEPETERMIKLRAANEALFTGRKHSAKPAWRAILYELGLQGKVTTEQLAKKWDNLKRRYKELKFPSRGSAESSPSSWPWYYRMNDAMEGRFATSAPLLTPIVEDGDEEFEPSSSSSPPPPHPPRKRARRRSSAGRSGSSGMAEFLTESEIDLLVDNEDKNGSSALGELHRMADGYTYKLTEEDTRSLIELRAANESLFTGRRNTAKPAWRGIVKQMGLTGKITPDQVAKKWDNLKTKYKDLKFPPRGMENQTNPASWPWFQLMSDAMEGRLAGKAPRVTPIWTNEEENVFGSSSPTPGDRDCLLVERGSMSELEESLGDTEADGVVTFIDASGEECSTPTDCSYKMTDQDTRRLIKLRAANEALFTGRRNAAKAAWKAILKELGLLGKVSTYQMSKKWDNLKRRYKDLKYPPVGMENMADSAASWPWFHLMNDAMEGRLTGGGPLLTPITAQDGDSGHPEPGPRHRSRPNSNQDRVSHQPHPTSSSSDYEGSNPSYADGGGGVNECQQRRGGGGGGGMEVEEDNRGMEMEREWEVLERERAAVERDRAAVQAERLWLERERAALERDRAMLEEERASLGRDREILENQRAMILNSVGHTGHLTNLGM